MAFVELTFQFDAIEDFCLLDMYCDNTMAELESMDWVAQTKFKYKTALEYDCGLGKQFDGTDMQTMAYTCGWDGNWNISINQPPCKCG